MKRVVLIFFSILSISSIAISQWSTDPYNNLIVGYGLSPELCSDSAGGCYITYEQGLAYPRHLILERLNRYGTKPWGSGKRITGEFEGQSDVKIVEDGQHGVIVSYRDVGEAVGRVKIQRVDSSGNFLWGASGVRVSLSETNQYYQAVVSDGQAGCIVAWQDTLNELRMQRINYLGERQWGDSGIVFATDGSGAPVMISDNKNGMIINWRYQKFQRVNGLGEKMWSDTGITTRGGSVKSSDGSGGAILAGMEYISYNNGDPLWRATCQKIDSSGNILWGSNGIIIRDSVRNRINILNPPPLSIGRNNSGDVIYCWSTRSDSNKMSSFLQRINDNGSLQFTDSLIKVSSCDTSSNTPVQIVNSDDETNMVLFIDSRLGGSLFIQKFDSLGGHCWNEDILASEWLIDVSDMIGDGNGGIIGVGFGQANFSIQVFQCSRDGAVGRVINDLREMTNEIPDKSMLYQNFPNPFNSSTLIKYDIPRSSHVKLEIYNLLGQKLSTLVDQFQQPGTHQINFEPSNLPSGMYLFKLQTPNSIMVKKLLILK